MRILGLGILAMLMAGSAVAQEQMAVTATSPFQNHLRSVMMVSPTQIYQTQNVKTDFQLGYQNTEGTTEATNTDFTNTKSMTDVYGAAVYAFPDTNLTLAVEAIYQTGTTEDDGKVLGVNVAKNEQDSSMWQFKPQLAYTMGSVILGAAVKMTGNTYEGVGTAKDKDNTYATYIPAIAFAQDNFEVGAMFESHARDLNPGTDEAMYNEPAVVAVHGRVAATPELAVGAVIANTNYKSLDDTKNDDQITVRGTAEYSQPAWRVEGDLGYNTAYYKEDTDMNNKNIATVELGTAADFKIHQNAMIGGLVRYEFGSDDVGGTDLAVSNFDIGVRGNWSF